MAYNHEYPYVDPNRYNSDWELNEIKALRTEMDTFEALNKITFSGEWDITKQYPAWTIVNTNDGRDGYISIQPVPKGVTIDNADYWRSVANYTDLIADLQNRVIDLENGLGTIIAEDITADQYSAAGTVYSLNGSGITAERVTIASGANVKDLRLNVSDDLGMTATGSNEDLSIENNNIEGTGATTFQIQSGADLENVSIHSNKITGTKYPLLLNECDSEKVRISNNSIVAALGDGIEVNSPNNTSTDIIITNNNIEGGLSGTDAGNGFGVGIAGGEKMVVSDNVIRSRKEGVHIESKSKYIVANANVIMSKSDGVSAGPDANAAPGVVSDSVLVGEGTGYGINMVFDATGSAPAYVIADSIIDNYAGGVLRAFATKYLASGNTLLDNIVIRNCEYGIIVTGKVAGHVLIENCTKPIRVIRGADIDDVTVDFIADPSNLFEIDSAAAPTIIRKLRFTTELTIAANGVGYVTLPFNATRSLGKMTVVVVNQVNAGDTVTAAFDLAPSTLTRLVHLPYSSTSENGTISGNDIIFNVNNGSGSEKTYHVTIECEGIFMI